MSSMVLALAERVVDLLTGLDGKDFPFHTRRKSVF